MISRTQKDVQVLTLKIIEEAQEEAGAQIYRCTALGAAVRLEETCFICFPYCKEMTNSPEFFFRGSSLPQFPQLLPSHEHIRNLFLGK